MSNAQDWIDDLTEPSEDEDSPSLFEENFRQMVEDGEVEDMAVTTLKNQVGRIDEPEILSEAMDVDDREEAQEIYQNRVAEINQDNQDSDDAETDQTNSVDAEPDEDSDAGGDGEDAEVAEEGEESSDVNDLIGEEEEPDPEGSESGVEGDGSEEDVSPSEEDGDSSAGSESGPEDTGDDPTGSEESSADNLPEVDVSSLAPDAMSRDAAAQQEKRRTLLVWGPEGSGKSHIAHSAPEPIAYIDTEGKADELAEKFDKRIHYFVADDYKEAKSALEQALDLLEAYREQGVTGTLVVDSMTAMWEYAKVDYAKFAYQTENLSEVNFQSELEGEKDWTKIKARHNDEFRETILDSPYHVVFTSGQKEDYNAVFEGGGKNWIPDGEKWNRYAVKDVVRLRRDVEGKTVGDLQKAAKTRYSFAGLEWPTFSKIYEAIDEIYAAEQDDEEIDVSDWPFDIIDGQPVGDMTEGSDEGDGDGD